MVGYTDPTLELTVDKDYLADGDDVLVSFSAPHWDNNTRSRVNNQVDVTVTSSGYDTSTGVITVSLTQLQTAGIVGDVEVQVNGWLDGARWASEIVAIKVTKNLYAQVMVYGTP